MLLFLRNMEIDDHLLDNLRLSIDRFPHVCNFLAYQQAIPMCPVSLVNKSLSFRKTDMEFGRQLLLELKLLFQIFTFISSRSRRMGSSLDVRQGGRVEISDTSFITRKCFASS